MYYNYKCKNCECQFEVKISPKELDKVVCPDCGGKELQRIYKNVAMFVKYGKYGGAMGPKPTAGASDDCLNCGSQGSGGGLG